MAGKRSGVVAVAGDSASAAAKPILIAVYTRKSNDENLTGEVTSLDNQKNCCRSYIEIQKEKGWREYPEPFDDPAESGKNLERPAMRRLLKTVEDGKVQGVIVYKLDRMTRSSKDFHHLLELFEKRGVAFISATESIDTKSPQGRLMTAIMVQFAQYDRELDVERSRDFHLARARKGLWSAGLPPLGYDVKDKFLIVNEGEAEVVRRAFDLYLRLKSTMRVAAELNRLGFRRKAYRTQRGKLYGGKAFDMETVIRMLRQRAYVGIIANARTGQEFAAQHPPIITLSVFEDAAKILVSHKRRDEEVLHCSNKHGFLLKGLIRCGECGAAVVGYIRPKKKKVYRYYRCMAKANGLPGRCSFKSIGAEKVEEFIIEKLAAMGWDRPFLEKVVRRVEEQSRASLEPLEKERRGMDDRLQAVRRDLDNLMNFVKGGGSSDHVAGEIRKLELAKREFEARTMELESKIAHRKRVVYDVDAIQGALQRFARFIRRIPLALQVQAIRLLVKRVTIWRDRVEAELHEVPVVEFERVITQEMKSCRALRRRGQKTTAVPGPGQNGPGTAVVESTVNWRGRRDLNPRSPP